MISKIATILLITLLLLDSCGFSYRAAIDKNVAGTVAGDKDSKSFPTIFSIRKIKDTTRFSVQFTIADVKEKDHCSLSDMKVSLINDKNQREHFNLYKIQLTRQSPDGHFISLETRLDSSMKEPAAFALTNDGTYYINYLFCSNRRRRHHIYMTVTATADMKKNGVAQRIAMTTPFERFFWFDIAGN